MAEKKKKSKTDIPFEKALTELEDVARKLESGSLGLDDSISEFDKGMKLAKLCKEKLDEAERKIELLQKGGNDRIEKKEISVKEETGEIEDDEEVQGSLL